LQKEKDEVLENLKARTNRVIKEKEEAINKLTIKLEEAAYREAQQVKEIKKYSDKDTVML
jgi:hypothetical protein